MERIDEIKKYIKLQYKTLCIFRFLSLYNIKKEDLDCFNTILDLLGIINLALNMGDSMDKPTYNKLVNDYLTLKELMAEYKNNVYPRFTISSLTFLDSFSMDVIDEFYEFKKELKKSKTNKDSLVEYMQSILSDVKNNDYRTAILSVMENPLLSEGEIDTIIGIFRKYFKDTNDISFTNKYNKLAFIYFDYLAVGAVCFH